MRRSERLLLPLGAVMLAALVLAPRTAGWPADELPPPVVAIIDLERLFNAIDRRGEAETDLEEQIQALQDRADVLRQQVERLKADLELLLPGTEKYEEAERKWRDAAVEYQAVVEFGNVKLDQLRAEARRELFRDITDAARRYADERGIDLIIADDSRLPLQEGSDMQVVQQLALRRVVFARPTYDVTEDLVRWMNSR